MKKNYDWKDFFFVLLSQKRYKTMCNINISNKSKIVTVIASLI